jgi:hypothetical protein
VLPDIKASAKLQLRWIEVLWILPFILRHVRSQQHALCVQVLPVDVDYRVMLTFLEFYHTLLQSVNYKLYHSLGVQYPPVVDPKMEEAAAGLEAIMQVRAQLPSAAAAAMNMQPLQSTPHSLQSTSSSVAVKDPHPPCSYLRCTSCILPSEEMVVLPIQDLAEGKAALPAPSQDAGDGRVQPNPEVEERLQSLPAKLRELQGEVSAPLHLLFVTALRA